MAARGEANVTEVILDVDTGTDDAVALIWAHLEPRICLVAVTCVNGNVDIDHVCENTLRVLDCIGASESVPVYRGMGVGLLREAFPNGDPFLGREVQSKVHGGYLPLPPATSAVRAEEDAVSFLIRTYSATDGPSTKPPPVLVATGPLTNVAMMLRLRPELAANIPKLIIMGGAHAGGNASASAEFNIWTDPEAAAVVLGAGIADLTLVPLDATRDASVHVDDIARLEKLGTLAGHAAAVCCEQLRGWLSRPRDCHFDDTPWLSLLKHLIKVQGGHHQMTVSPTARLARPADGGVPRPAGDDGGGGAGAAAGGTALPRRRRVRREPADGWADGARFAAQVREGRHAAAKCQGRTCGRYGWIPGAAAQHPRPLSGAQALKKRTACPTKVTRDTG